ncbi:MAG: ROK family protein [Lentisphaeria bacterium]|nr:ROK family protein [Lentisphaeria bacterium]
MSTGPVWIGFDLGATKMLAKVFDDDFKELGSKRRRTKGHEGVEAGLERIVETIEAALKDAKIEKEQIAGIGLGCPGPLDLDKGILLNTPNLGWQNAPIRKELEKAFGCPAVIANDVDSGVYGEFRFGAAKGARCVLGVFPGTGIGGGCVYEGRILRGRRSSILEIGHMQVIPDGPLCGCGRRGCVEAVASRLAIASAALAAAYRGEAPHLRKTTELKLEEARSTALADSVAAGDKAVEAIVRQAARWIGVAVGNAVNLLGPDVVVLGGGLVEALPKLFLEEVSRSVEERVMPSFLGTFSVVAAKLGDDATVQGAAGWAREVIQGRA